MSAAKQHQEWLSLLEVSGPFIALPVLKRILPHGLPKLDGNLRKELRIAYQEWQNSQEDGKLRTSYNTAWIRYVLREVLGYPTELLAEGAALPGGYEVYLSEHSEKLQPDAAIIVPEGRQNQGRARLLVACYPSNQSLDRALPQTKSKWSASPATRMMELLRRTSVELGLVTNGEQWMLVYAAPGETTTFASWYANVWLDEEVTLQSFVALISVARIFGTSDNETLEALFRQSTEFQQEVSDLLGLQVRKAVELLIQALDRIDKDTGRSLLTNVSEKELYEAGVSVMMRLVFILAAEERSLFPINFEVYSVNYAVSTLREQLHESAASHGEAVLEHRFDAWNRLLATFRLIFGGSRHEDLNSPAYGGSLFDPDRYPFLEGRQQGTNWYESEVDPLPLNNRVVLHLLESLQLLKGKGPKDEARKLSFRAVDVEQIGNVYESLLEHTAIRAQEPVLGLVGSKGKEPEVPLSILNSKKEAGEKEFLAWLEEETGKSVKSLTKLLDYESKLIDSKFLMACDNDPTLFESIKPFAGLIREDTLELPVIFTTGSVYVTEGSERRSTGTHYTPRSLTEPIIEHTLAPLIYQKFSDGVVATRETLIPPSEILQLKICDMTCGSGAFLVQACRYLGDKLAESWRESENGLDSTSYVLDFNGNQFSVEDRNLDTKHILPASDEERQILARRLVADRCLYGVDCNPMAVEMAKLSLWLVTLQRDRAFTFVDHAIKCGDSLVGLSQLDQLQYFDFKPDYESPLRRLSEMTTELIESAKEKRLKLEGFTVGDICDADQKEKLNLRAEQELSEARQIGDVLAFTTLVQPDSLHLSNRLDEVSLKIAAALRARKASGGLSELHEKSRRETAKVCSTFVERKPFHWFLEYPEVFIRSNAGFDAIVGNPPFIGGKKITGILGSAYRDFLIDNLADGKRGHADICAYFFLRASALSRKGGAIGLLATNTISEGDTREVGLDKVCSSGANIFRAIKSQKWPGAANLEVAMIWLYRGNWRQSRCLDNVEVPFISSYLASQEDASGKPHVLFENADISFIGSYVLGMGFTLTMEQAQNLLNLNSKNSTVLFPFLNGEDVNKNWNQAASRYAINFFDWPLRRGAIGDWLTASENERQDWMVKGIVPSNYQGSVAADYSECLNIIDELVKPERTRTKENSDEFALRYPLYLRWWQYADRRPALYKALASLDRVLVIPLVSKYFIVSWQPTNQVFSHALGVVACDKDSMFAILQSTFHEIWARQCGSTLRVDPRYTPSDCFETFPFPKENRELIEIGKRYSDARQELSQNLQEGLTKIYNRVHSKSDQHEQVEELRSLHKELDEAVLRAYGWREIILDHDFRTSDRGYRYTISENCKRKLFYHLFKLNQERHAAEEAAGLFKKIRTKGKTTRGKNDESRIGSKTDQIKLEFGSGSAVGALDDD